ncbi:MAG: RsmB/NOP family class I SAM-dependent RNA methyltransferase [Ignavibacteria bacterium]|nr:RsmB/NOP family class I SAM-dependent RNA methyltransferase [Ignavibacteria bacterium]
MQLSSLLGHAAELVRIIRKSPQPGDAIASEYFRSKKYIGASDRRFISGLVFHTLRTLSLSEAIQQHFALEDIVHGAHMLLEQPEQIDQTWLASLPVHARICTQDWLLASTQLRWPDDAWRVWDAMTSAAPLVLRVNLRRASRDALLRKLIDEGLNATAGELSPAAILIHQRVNLLQHPLYLNGIVEVQDEGSQLIGYACAPREDDIVFDACAGAGGKTLHIADLQNDHGRVIAHDIEWNRLKEIPKRAERAGLRSIKLETSKQRDQRGLPQADVVLVDAPCSGLGTVRRLPTVKWRITPETLARHARKQLQVLEQYADIVSPGGVLVYATCSIMPEENERVVEQFLSTHTEFAPDPLAPCFDRHGITIPGILEEQESLQVDPYHHNTDGLFMARMRRLAE